MDLLICALTVVFLVVNIKEKDLFLYFFVFVIFDSVYIIPFIGLSLVWVYYLLFAARVVMDIRYKKIYLKTDISDYIILFFVVTSFVYGNSHTVFSNIINSLIILYLNLQIKNSADRGATLCFQDIFKALLLVICASGLYGFLRGNYIQYGSIKRFFGVMPDPNYSAMFFMIGIASYFGLETKKRKDTVLFLIICLMLLMTVSISGMVGFVVIMFLYLLFRYPQKVGQSVAGALSAVFAFTVCGIIFPKSTVGAFVMRVIGIIEKLASGAEMAEVTSERSGILEKYIEEWKQLPLGKMLFGGINTPEGVYVEKIGFLSHNTYVDLLFMLGMVGTIALLTLLAVKFGIMVKEYHCFRKEEQIGCLLLLASSIYFMLSLTMFPYRYFYTFILLAIPNYYSNQKTGEEICRI